MKYERAIFETDLLPLIKENYALRKKGLLPDEMFWADEEGLALGYVYDPDEDKVISLS